MLILTMAIVSCCNMNKVANRKRHAIFVVDSCLGESLGANYRSKPVKEQETLNKFNLIHGVLGEGILKNVKSCAVLTLTMDFGLL